MKKLLMTFLYLLSRLTIVITIICIIVQLISLFAELYFPFKGYTGKNLVDKNYIIALDDTAKLINNIRSHFAKSLIQSSNYKQILDISDSICEAIPIRQKVSISIGRSSTVTKNKDYFIVSLTSDTTLTAFSPYCFVVVEDFNTYYFLELSDTTLYSKTESIYPIIEAAKKEMNDSIKVEMAKKTFAICQNQNNGNATTYCYGITLHTDTVSFMHNYSIDANFLERYVELRHYEDVLFDGVRYKAPPKYVDILLYIRSYWFVCIYILVLLCPFFILFYFIMNRYRPKVINWLLNWYI